ncbi:hypothetical protein ACFE04_022720 [Oxalis oulophora]
MESYFLPSKTSPPPQTTTILPSPATTRPQHVQLPLLRSRKSLRLTSTNGTTNDTSENNVQPPPQLPQAVAAPPQKVTEIKFRRRSKRQTKQMKEDAFSSTNTETRPPAIPKKWEDMTLSEKALEIYVGEKGMLFWLNKFAYASIYIVIGGWILFRFVGPALNFYQLDTPPLSPTAILKG